MNNPCKPDPFVSVNTVPSPSATHNPTPAMSSPTLESSIPLIDLSQFLSGNPGLDDAAKVTQSLESYGAVLVRDPRVSAEDSDDFVNMMERYFAQPREEKLCDARPQYFYQ
eukprot:IDg16842t1